MGKMINQDLEAARKKRIELYGSFLHCPQRGVLCFYTDTIDGKCARSICCLDDPEYVELQERIEANRRKNYELHLREKAEEERAKAKIRRETKTRLQLLEEKVGKKKELSQYYYTRGWTRKGDETTNEIIRLNALIDKERNKGAKDDK